MRRPSWLRTHFLGDDLVERRRGPHPFVLFLVTCVFIAVLVWKAEYDSCHRASSNRAFMTRVLDQVDPDRLLARPDKMSCKKPLPDNQ